MSTTFTDWEHECLAHFGIRGMKWGQRRFQNPDGTLTSLGLERYGKGGNRSALGTKHDLNKLDREQTNAKARYDYYNGKATRQTARATRKMKKAQQNNDYEKVNKYKAKIQKINEGASKKASEYKQLLERSRKMTDHIIKNALAKGYSIKSRDCLRSVNKGRNAATSILATAGGMALAATTGVGFTYSQGSYAPGTHYRVRNDGYGIRTHRSRRFTGSGPSLMYAPSRNR